MNESQMLQIIDKDDHQIRKVTTQLSAFLKTLEIRNPMLFHLIAAFDKLKSAHGQDIKPILVQISLYLHALSPFNQNMIQLFHQIKREDFEKFMMLMREFNLAFLELFLQFVDKEH